jgi:thiosulfate dehydrogenase [quinone] large subunit
MKKLKDVRFLLRVATGIIIMLHGLLRIVNLNEYVDFVVANFSRFLGGEFMLTVWGFGVPFIEFCVGLLLTLNIGYKKTIITGIVISFTMSVFLIAGSMYPKLIYHGLVLVLLSTLYSYTTPSGVSRLMRQ